MIPPSTFHFPLSTTFHYAAHSTPTTILFLSMTIKIHKSTFFPAPNARNEKGAVNIKIFAYYILRVKYYYIILYYAVLIIAVLYYTVFIIAVLYYTILY